MIRRFVPALLLVLWAGQARATEADGWHAALLDDIAADLAAGKPLVVEAHVPLCSNQVLRCGGHGLGDGDAPDTNLYWATSGGFEGWFGRKGSGWTAVGTDGASGEVLPCTTTDLGESEGNLRERPLREIWAKGFTRFRQRGQGVCSDGKECWLQSRNGNGCREQAFGCGARRAG